MDKVKLLLVGTHEQSDYENWRNGVIVDNDDFDAAVVVIPNYKKLEAEPICDILRNTAKPVCVLKMRLNSYDDLEPLRNLTDEQRSRLFIGEQYQYQSGALKLKSLLATNLLGNVESVSWRTVLKYEHADWMDAYNHMILEDLSYHHFTDLIIWFGEIHGTVYADSFAPKWMRDKGFASAIIKTDNGIHITYDVRWGAAETDTTFFGDITVQGDKGQLRTNGNGETTPLYQGWAGVIDHFCDVVNGKSAVSSDGVMLTFDQFDNAAKLMYSAVKSAETNNREVF
jgi:Predicted dehydrogenases and related proteins